MMWQEAHIVAVAVAIRLDLAALLGAMRSAPRCSALGAA